MCTYQRVIVILPDCGVSKRVRCSKRPGPGGQTLQTCSCVPLAARPSLVVAFALEMQDTGDESKALQRSISGSRNSAKDALGEGGRVDGSYYGSLGQYGLHWDSVRDRVGRMCECPDWAMTATELTGVVLAWTGIEW